MKNPQHFENIKNVFSTEVFNLMLSSKSCEYLKKHDTIFLHYLGRYYENQNLVRHSVGTFIYMYTYH